MTRKLTISNVTLDLDLEVAVDLVEDDDGLPDPYFTGNSMTGMRHRRVAEVSLDMSDAELLERVKRAIDKQIDLTELDDVKELEYDE